MRYFKNGKEIEPKWYNRDYAQVIYGLLIGWLLGTIFQFIVS